jgi:hypothetical protein
MAANSPRPPPRAWSLDAPLNNRLNRPWMSAVAVIASSAVSLANVQRRRQVLAARAAETSGETRKNAPAGTA